MLVTFDTEDPEVTGLVSQFLQEHIQQRMMAVLSTAEAIVVHTPRELSPKSGYFMTDAQVALARRVAEDVGCMKGCQCTYSQMLTRKLMEKLLAYAKDNYEVTPAEQCAYMNSLIAWITETIKTGDPNAIDSIRSLWNDESWESIQAKLLEEASTWRVWWMDGVRRYIAIDRGWLPNGDSPGISKPEEAHGPHNHQQE